MRNRPRPEEQDREHTQEREDTRRVRIPKIQYRFLKELDEKGINGETRVGALAMADKIKRYPLGAQHVMASWERFTRKAIEEFKAGRGDNAARDRQHVAYAVLFSALKDGRQAASIGELKQHIEVFSAGRPPASVDHGRRDVAQPAARQQSLLEQERPTIERQIEQSLGVLRNLSPQLRGTVEAAARELLVEGHHTSRSARDALPGAVRELQAERNERNTVHTLTLAVVAKTAEQPALLREAAALPQEQVKEIEAEARARLERYPPLETGLADVRRDATDAAVRDAVAASPETRREALVLARAREELERVADPNVGTLAVPRSTCSRTMALSRRSDFQR